MSAEPRRFRLHRVEDVSGVSGTGVVAEGVVFSDGWAVLHWLDREPMNEPTIVTWLNKGHEGVVKVHGHGGATRIEWLDIPNPIPAADYDSVCAELRGYVEHAVDDGGMIAPELLLDYLDELKRRALTPARQWMTDIMSAGESGEAS
ncbi:hypothetical protein [Nonomuraea guangzhouensis]|uniref:Uncharacterized protein n=1 Tax=Nonomuraea guangzhouensis TaxID=1291555 RepID=A0ABW4GX54_9ACTN|nr:hypothetical protein [Nonomuraea guangzhouensis]